MKYKVSELEGAMLDAAVAKAEGYELDEDGDNRTIRENGGAPSKWHPSTDWVQGGPIIERERMQIQPHRTGSDWLVTTLPRDLRVPSAFATGPSVLIAAMRAYVASKFGDEVELP